MQLNYKFLIGIERELTNGSAHSLRSDRNALCAEIQPVKVGRKIYRDCAPNKTAELDTALPQVKQSIKLQKSDKQERSRIVQYFLRNLDT